MVFNKKVYTISAWLVFCILISIDAIGQNKEFAKEIISELCSKEFAGRGYTNKGDSLAAVYVKNKLKKLKAKPFKNSYFQDFHVNVNTFPSLVEVKMNGTSLVGGYDYLVDASSCSVNGEFPVVILNKNVANYPSKLREIDLKKLKDSFILVDTAGIKNKGFKDAVNEIVNSNLFNAKGIIELQYQKLVHRCVTYEKSNPKIHLHRDALPDTIESFEVNIENKFINDYRTRNVCAFFKGEIDSFIVFTAHYDHLGQMGKDVYFPGANDNASGVSMVIDLARHFSKNRKSLKYSVAFLFFSAEELGFLGSKYYVENPLFPLAKIKRLINLDMVGTGGNGITVVNGSVFKNEFDKLTALNKKGALLPDIKIRGAATNSDHYPFYNKGVKSLFIYTEGDYNEYQSIFDSPKELPLTEYEDLFRLLIEYTKSF